MSASKPAMVKAEFQPLARSTGKVFGGIIDKIQCKRNAESLLGRAFALKVIQIQRKANQLGPTCF